MQLLKHPSKIPEYRAVSLLRADSRNCLLYCKTSCQYVQQIGQTDCTQDTHDVKNFYLGHKTFLMALGKGLSGLHVEASEALNSAENAIDGWSKSNLCILNRDRHHLDFLCRLSEFTKDRQRIFDAIQERLQNIGFTIQVELSRSLF